MSVELPEEVVVAFKRSFDEIDADGDGLISAAELQAHLKTLNITTSGAEIAEILSRFDTTGGTVAPLTFDSFFKLMSQSMKIPDTDEMVQDAFAAFDLDRDSAIGADDLAQVYQTLGEAVTAAEVEELIRSADRTGTGNLDQQEFSQWMASTD